MTVIITGVSGGIGRALAEKFIELGCQVIGIGRNTGLADKNFRFISCDLSKTDEIQRLDFGQIKGDVVLVNNAGVIGNIQRLSDQEFPDALEVLTVNTIAPMLLSAKVMKITESDQQITIVNISSGAGRRSIPSWASYCASKAALDRFSETFYLEEIEKARKIKVYSIAPGVIDTPMQNKIRQANPIHFSSRERFLELKENEQLKSAEETADQILQLINSDTFDPSNIVCSL